MIDTSNGSVELPVSKPSTDWADEIAAKLVYMTNTSSKRGVQRAINRLAAALRGAKQNGRDEVALVLREIYEEWAGSEGFIPQTCGEAYALELAKRMADIAARALKDKQP
jgi:hypothetical protein